MKSESDFNGSASEIEVSFLSVAMAAAKAGLSIVPPCMNGSKAPIGSWKTYQHFPAEESVIRRWYGNTGLTGLGVVTGKVSGNLECFEFDDRATYERFKSAADAAGLGGLVNRIEAGYCEVSPKPGVHWLYRCEEIGGNTKLATCPKPSDVAGGKNRTQVLIETRGEGGFVILAPSNGKTHPSGGAYSLVSGGVDSIVTVSPEDRRELFALARTFDQPSPKIVEQAERDNTRNHRYQSGKGWHLRAGDDFNARADWKELLEAQGWTFVFRQEERDYWRRPGKATGVSACTNWQGKDYFYCWSTSTEFDAEKPLDKFGFYAKTCHGGDFKAAVKALTEGGYGQSAKPKADGGGIKISWNPAPGSPWRQIPDEADASSGPPPLIRINEDGREKLLSQQHAAAILREIEFSGSLRFDPHTQNWYRYQSESGIFQQQPALLSESAVYQAIRKHSNNFPFSAAYVSGVAKCLVWESVAEITPAPGKVCFTNGVLDLATRELLPHSPDHGFMASLPFAWLPDSPEPQPVIDWLMETVGGKLDQIQLLRAYLNAAITGRADLQRFLELIGPGGGGKGSYIRLVTALLGNEAVHSTTLKELENNRFESAKLFGKKLVVITDAERWHGDVSMLKAITGQDPIRFEQKHRQAGSNFTYGGMVLIAANQHTESTDYSSGIQRRRITVNFNHVVPAHQRRDLESEFQPWLPAVAAWALAMPAEQVTAYLRNTSQHVASLAASRIEALTATNPVAAWMMDSCKFDPAAQCQIGVKRKVVINSGRGDGDHQTETRVVYENSDRWLYPNYVLWCDTHGKNPVAHNLFSNSLIDVAKNMLGKDVEKLAHKKSGASIRGLYLIGDELCRQGDELVTNCDELVTNYPIERVRLDELDELSISPDKNGTKNELYRQPATAADLQNENVGKNLKETGEVHQVRQVQPYQQLSSSPVHHQFITSSSPAPQSSSPSNPADAISSHHSLGASPTARFNPAFSEATLTPDGLALWKVIKLTRGAETVRRLSEKSGIWSLERTMTAAQELAALGRVTITSDLIAPAQETRP